MYVLIVEDSKTQAELLGDMLKRHGFEAVIAKDGKRATELVRVRKPSLIISDVIMPVMDGYELCVSLKKDPASRDIPIILLTALSETRDVARALQAGADNFITKPYQEEYLINRVKSILSAPRRRIGGEKAANPIRISHDGEDYRLFADRMKVFDFFLSAYDAAIIQHNELQRAQEKLRISNENLSNLNEIISIGNRPGHPDATLSALLEKTVNLLGYRMGGIISLTKERTSAEFQFIYGKNPKEIAVMQSFGLLDLTDSIYRDFIEDGNSLFLSRSEGDAESAANIFQKNEVDNCSVLPLIREGVVAGAIFLFNGRNSKVSDEEKGFLETVASEISTAAEKAFLLKRLEMANEETNLYLDIMAHDINNANTGAMGYLEILNEFLEGPDKEYAEKSLASVHQSAEIISNVSTIRILHERTTALRAVNLDSVIRAEILRYGNVIFHYSGTDVMVLADDLIGQIFMNLLGNSVKFSTVNPEITITVKQDGQDVFVTVADRGPGISDEIKPLIFDRFRKEGRKSGKGLGLYIARKLVEEYGGSIQADDRVPGKPEEGAAIRFVLKAAS